MRLHQESRSQPSWAAWIEIPTLERYWPYGFCRSPLGLRGLKSIEDVSWIDALGSQPSWAAWIEIIIIGYYILRAGVAALLGCVD